MITKSLAPQTLNRSHCLLFRIIVINISLVLSAQIYIPLGELSITCHTLALMFLSCCMNPYEVLFGLCLYYLEASAGLPTLAGWVSDPQWYLSARAGFFVGFPFAVWYINKRLRKNQSYLHKFLVFFMAHFIILSSGVAGIALKMGAIQSLKTALLPLLFPAIIKSLLLVFITQAFSSLGKGKFASPAEI